ncbi:PHB depolymerase family esterase [Fulvivirga sedimenti]|uniref:T9SS type A sorting domain-containing protein n=1 Tax=Fulvivirga sedimenti TaxID=2879465 RepID=A0A9X1L1M4_9BACT|nr:PHB depolymerase family esterase [Fulvivirga sedimenti]MCA6078964.1 T9SS type A sorting domain-containing protein [Fulvivirga sedimenti]
MIRRNILLLPLLILLWTSSFGQFIRKTVQHDGETRTYLIHLPSGYNGETNLPLVINLHGFGSNATEQSVYSRFNFLSDVNDFIVVYPEGLVATLPLGTGQHWDAYFGTGVDDLGFIDLMIDLLWNEYSIDLSRVYATGMSNGGYMSFMLACELSDRIAAIGSVTGSMVRDSFTQCDPQRPVPVIQFHGTDDGVVAYDGSDFGYSIPDVMNYWVEQNTCAGDPVITELEDTDPDDNSTVTRTVYSNCEGEVAVDFYRINGGGHTWPGAIIDQPQLGVTNKDISAHTLIWEFFTNYTHPNPREPRIITSLDEAIAKGTAIYPTLASDRLRIHIEQPAVLSIINLKGSTVTQDQLSPGDHSLNIISWPQGAYIVRLIQADGSVFSERIIKI